MVLEDMLEIMYLSLKKENPTFQFHCQKVTCRCVRSVTDDLTVGDVLVFYILFPRLIVQA